MTPSPPTRTALVTGANRGLGLATSAALAERGFRVLVTSRTAAAAEAAAAPLIERGLAVQSLPLDVSDAASITALVDRLQRQGITLDVLVHNAGVYDEGADIGAARRVLASNYFGPRDLSDALLPRLADGGTVVMVSSGMGELATFAPELRRSFLAADLDRGRLDALMDAYLAAVAAGTVAASGFPASAYRVSKAGLNALVRITAPAVVTRRIVVNAVCPGWVRTDMGGENAPRDLDTGAASIVWAALRQGEPTGGFFRDGRAISW